PGRRTSSFLTGAPTLATTVRPEEVFHAPARPAPLTETWRAGGAGVGTVTLPPLDTRLTLTACSPPVSVTGPGFAEFASSTATLTTGALELTRLKNWSVTRTVAVKPTPAVWVAGVPARPTAVPGAEVSPGTITSTRSAVAGVMSIAGWEALLVVGTATSFTNTVRLPDLRRVRPAGKVCTPASATEKR